MKLLPKELRHRLPALRTQDVVEDPIVMCKFFYPDFPWIWYAIEFDGKDTFFGWVAGDFQELGYFTLSELKHNRGMFGCPIERDLDFTPKPLSAVKQLHQRAR